MSIPVSFASGKDALFPVDCTIGSDSCGRPSVRSGFPEFVTLAPKWAADVQKWVDISDL